MTIDTYTIGCKGKNDLNCHGIRKGGITTGVALSPTSKCSLPPILPRLLNFFHSDRTLSCIRSFVILHFCALRLAQKPLSAPCQSVGSLGAKLPPGSCTAHFSLKEWCKYILYHAQYILHKSQHCFVGFAQKLW